MKIRKSYYFNSCKIAVKIFPLLIGCLFLLSCQPENTKQTSIAQIQPEISGSALNINTASAEQLEKLPYVGAKTARKIVDFREKYGAFRKPEHLLLIDRIGDRQFREMKNFIKVE